LGALTAEDLTMAAKKAAEPLKLGDWVKIRHTGFERARIVELRGPLGPGGAEVYRVRVSRKPLKPLYIELLAKHRVLLPPKKGRAAQQEPPASDGPTKGPERGGTGDA
jgi:hypothetical protein